MNGPAQSWLLSGLPFLPPGKGGMILIMGGLAVLSVALFWSLLATRSSAGHAVADGPLMSAQQRMGARGHTGARRPPRPRGTAADRRPQAAPQTVQVPRQAPSAPAAQAPGGQAHVQTRQVRGSHASGHAPWAVALADAAPLHGLGETWVLRSDERRCLLLLRHCPGCRTRSRRRGGCREERHAIARAARPLAGRVEVVEVYCKPRRRRGCAFEVRRGGGR